MKAAEFMKLTQWTKTLTEYMHAFNNLSRYAPAFVDTKEKKDRKLQERPWHQVDENHGQL